MIKTLGHTANFTIKYQDTIPHAKHRAQQLMAAVEGDFAILRGWFKNVDGFGPNNRVTVQLEDSGGGGWNQGYHADGKTKIVADPLDYRGIDPVADDCVIGIFVAEAIEVLMSWLNQKTGKTTWDPAASNGEGLSRVAFGVLRPLGYYAFFGPCVNVWLQKNPRPDWFKANEDSDTDMVSFGAATLFIYWLHSQLGCSWEDIVLKGGATLKDTYHALKGQNDATHDFLNFIEPYLPAAEAFQINLWLDDPFPLKKARDVSLVCEQAPNGKSTIASSGTANIRPLFCAKAKNYDYDVVDSPVTLTCTATASGFAMPVFSWKINGEPVDFQDMTISASVRLDDPLQPLQSSTSIEDIEISCSHGWLGNGFQADVLLIDSKDHLGHEQLTIEVSVKERYLPSHHAGSYATAFLDTQSVKYEDAYYEDGSACRAAMMKRLSQYRAYDPIPLYLTLPDPAPELRRAAHFLERVREDLANISLKDADLAAHLGRDLARSLGVSERLLTGGR